MIIIDSFLIENTMYSLPALRCKKPQLGRYCTRSFKTTTITWHLHAPVRCCGQTWKVPLYKVKCRVFRYIWRWLSVLVWKQQQKQARAGTHTYQISILQYKCGYFCLTVGFYFTCDFVMNEGSRNLVLGSSVRVFVSMQYFVPIAHKVKYFKFG